MYILDRIIFLLKLLKVNEEKKELYVKKNVIKTILY
jgi:hypothetical protein